MLLEIVAITFSQMVSGKIRLPGRELILFALF